MRAFACLAAALVLSLSAGQAQELLVAEQNPVAPGHMGEINHVDALNQVQSTLLDLGSYPGSIAIDPVQQQVFWIQGLYEIRGADLNGQGEYTLHCQALQYWNFPNAGLAVDGATGTVFFSDMDGVYSVDQNGMYQVLLRPPFNIAFSGGLALDLQAGKMYYSGVVQYVDPIYSANLDGSNVQTLFTHPSMFIGALSVDTRNGRIHFADDRTPALWSVNMQGLDLRLHSYRGYRVLGVAVDEDAGKLYWVEGRNVMRSNVDGNQVETVYQSVGTATTGVAVQVQAPTAPLAPLPLSGAPASCGDCLADGDGPNVIDALAAARLGASMEMPGTSLDNCDVDGSGDVNIMDALRIAQASARVRESACSQ